MNVTSITPTSKDNAAGGRTSLANQFDNFLTLLTKQLEYQDPLSPMDANAFTEQLVQFTSVEQSVAMNQKLDTLVSQLTGDTLNRGVGYLGTHIQAEGKHIVLGDEGGTSASVSLERTPNQVTVTVTNAAGDVVADWHPPLRSGQQDLYWDGLGNAGNRLPAGTYSIDVDARDSRGIIIPASTTVAGEVTGVEDRDGSLILWVSNREIALDDVTTVRSVTSVADEASDSSQDDEGEKA